jgi:hypothetical protein
VGSAGDGQASKRIAQHVTDAALPWQHMGNGIIPNGGTDLPAEAQMAGDAG